MKAAVVDAVGAGFKIAEVELARPLGREVHDTGSLNTLVLRKD
jgi:hypothetical protein